MKKLVLYVVVIMALALAGEQAQASIRGQLGLTGRLGLLIPADNEADYLPNHTDAGLVGGGGILYGIDDYLALSGEITRTSFGSETGDFGVTDFSLGGQYRFQSRTQLVPFVGIGLDVLASDYDPYDRSYRDVDTTVGAHILGGVDYFLRRELALTAEAKVLLAPNVAITNRFGDHVGRFDPSNVTGTVGLRYFFGGRH